MERGVVIGGLMICGSFLLAALLNRSAVEEVPAPPPPPAVVTPLNPAAPEPGVAPRPVECAEIDTDPAATKTEQPASDRCTSPTDVNF